MMRWCYNYRYTQGRWWCLRLWIRHKQEQNCAQKFLKGAVWSYVTEQKPTTQKNKKIYNNKYTNIQIHRWISMHDTLLLLTLYNWCWEASPWYVVSPLLVGCLCGSFSSWGLHPVLPTYVTPHSLGVLYLWIPLSCIYSFNINYENSSDVKWIYHPFDFPSNQRYQEGGSPFKGWRGTQAISPALHQRLREENGKDDKAT